MIRWALGRGFCACGAAALALVAGALIGVGWWPLAALPAFTAALFLRSVRTDQEVDDRLWARKARGR